MDQPTLGTKKLPSTTEAASDARSLSRRRALLRIGAVVLGFLVLALGLWAANGGLASGGMGQPANGGPRVGQAAPDFTLQTLDKRSVQLSAYRGKPVLINFWATWCVPCQTEMPAIDAVARAHPDLVVLAVDSMEGPVLVQRYQDQHPYSFRPLLDPTGEVVARYHVDGLPTSYFVAPDGTIRTINIGPMTQSTIEKNVAAASARQE
ncbi:MAG TPA: redoxin domain-containing protein [Chloroflexota bacterium]|nr:redoxin domain-containing protein [Chloroflexota bacterium]